MTAIDDVFVCQQIRSRNHHRTNLMQGDDKRPELIATFQNTHHHVVLLDADSGEVRHDVVAHPFDVGKRETTLFTFVVCPKQSQFVRIGPGPLVNNVIAEVEVVRYYYLKILLEILQ